MKHNEDTKPLMNALNVMSRPERTHMGLARDMFATERSPECQAPTGPILQRGARILRRSRRPKLMDPVTAQGFFEHDKRKESPREKAKAKPAEAIIEPDYLKWLHTTFPEVTLKPDEAVDILFNGPDPARMTATEVRTHLEAKRRKHALNYGMTEVKRKAVAQKLEGEAEQLAHEMARERQIKNLIGTRFFRSRHDHDEALRDARTNRRPSKEFPGVIVGYSNEGIAFYLDEKLNVMKPSYYSANASGYPDFGHKDTRKS